MQEMSIKLDQDFHKRVLQSIDVQNICFAHGIGWVFSGKVIRTDHFYRSRYIIVYSSSSSNELELKHDISCTGSDLPCVTYDEFMDLYDKGVGYERKYHP